MLLAARSTRRLRFWPLVDLAFCERFCLYLQVDFDVDVGAIKRNKAEPSSDRV
jgi:hypothetical protein